MLQRFNCSFMILTKTGNTRFKAGFILKTQSFSIGQIKNSEPFDILLLSTQNEVWCSKILDTITDLNENIPFNNHFQSSNF